MNNNLRIGTEGELAVAARMAKLGFNISIPLGSQPYDLIAEKDGICRRVQVKSATLQPRGSYRASLSYGRSNKSLYCDKLIDVMVAYAPYSQDYEGIHDDGFYVIKVEGKLEKYHATLFPVGMGKGHLSTCSWEKYRDAWDTI